MKRLQDLTPLSQGLLAAAAPVAIYSMVRGVQALATSRLRNKVVLITGGSRGLGLVTARHALTHGAKVAICSRGQAEVSSAVRQLANEFGAHGVYGGVCDVIDEADANKFVHDVIEHFGQLDLLINNAGIIQVGPAELMDRKDFAESVETHFWGAYNMIMAALPELRRQQGRIANVISVGGKLPVPHLLPYSVGKFALAGLSEGLSTELAKEGVSVTSVYPGLMRTGSHRNAKFKGQHRKEHAWFSIGGSLPFLSASADRAARRILSAAMLRQPLCIFPFSCRALIWGHHLAPRAMARALQLVNRFLPAAGGIGHRQAKGFQSESAWSPSLLTSLSDQAAAENNEMVVQPGQGPTAATRFRG